jgi:ATP-dependent Clp protease ATP-binding subunit ClpA
VLGAAAEEARRLGHGSVGPEELLLSLFAPAGAVAAQVLAELGIARAEVERQLREAGGGPASPGAPDGEAEPGVRPYTPAAVDLLRGSVEEALRLGHNYVGTEHLLLALARHSESAASRVLIALGGSHDAVREKTLSALAEHRKS